VALAAAALKEKTFYPPFDDSGFERPATQVPETIAVTGWGHWRGESLAVLRAEG
jgi:3-oxoacyl-[acyl-carrier-protein] synthase II